LWYVYFLELSNGDIVVGSTDDLRRRLASHQQGRVVSASKYFAAVLRSYVAVADEATARSLERYFKSGSGKAFAEKRFLQKRANDERDIERDIMSSKTPDPLANRAFTIWGPLDSMAGAR
jgi:putative endonuclease